MVLIVKRRDNIKYYKSKAYVVTKNGIADFAGKVIVGKKNGLPIIGQEEATDAVSAFSYALLKEDAKGNITGARNNILDQASFDIGIYENNLTEDNLASADEIVEYNECFPVAKISELQDKLKYELNMKIKKEEPKHR